MDEVKIRLLELAWRVFVGACTAACVIVPFVWNRLRPRWAHRRWTPLVPGWRGGRDLRRLARTLGQLICWIDHGKTEMSRNISCELSKVQHAILAESYSYLAIHSKKDKERCSGLRFLSQVEGEEWVNYAEGTIRGVISDRDASEEVISVAKAALKELEELQKMEERRSKKKSAS